MPGGYLSEHQFTDAAAEAFSNAFAQETQATDRTYPTCVIDAAKREHVTYYESIHPIHRTRQRPIQISPAPQTLKPNPEKANPHED